MIVVCDGVDQSDYPVFVKRGEDARAKVRELSGMPMQRVLEVFNLSVPPSWSANGLLGTRVIQLLKEETHGYSSR